VNHPDRIVVALGLLALAAVAGPVGGTQDAGKSRLQAERVLLDNRKVRVLEYTSRPSGGVCGVDRHSHPAHVTIVMEAARDREAPEGGKPVESDLKVGDVLWSEAGTHVDVNVGSTNSRLIVVEIK